MQIILEKLTHIGFTKLESEVYLHLLKNGTLTGYAVAKGIGKAVANVYKAVETLSQKGAVEFAMSNSKLCTAVPWRQLLASQRKKFDDDIENLSECLKQLPEKKNDERVYQISHIEQVLQQGIRIIGEAEYILLADMEPEAISLFEPYLIAAAERGVEVRIEAYEPVDLPNVNITLRRQGKQIYQKIENIQFSLCADGQNMMLALITLDKSEVIQAFHSKSALINMSIYYKLLYGLILADLKFLITEGDVKGAQKLLEDTAHLHPYGSENTVFKSFTTRYKLVKTNHVEKQ
jgi:sugar-specific transcriptional regulator TrmB